MFDILFVGKEQGFKIHENVMCVFAIWVYWRDIMSKTEKNPISECRNINKKNMLINFIKTAMLNYFFLSLKKL
jgi:hypothetical protein